MGIFGWGGWQRFAITWTGDQKGSLDWIKWHVPTVTGACMSGMNGATASLAGIFNGTDSKATYVRCWQWFNYSV